MGKENTAVFLSASPSPSGVCFLALQSQPSSLFRHCSCHTECFVFPYSLPLPECLLEGSSPFSLCLVISKSFFIYLLSFCCLPEACPGGVSAQLCGPSGANFSWSVSAHFLTCVLYPDSELLWVRRCSHHCWLTVQVCDQPCHNLLV